jgi:hypothetical protein
MKKSASVLGRICVAAALTLPGALIACSSSSNAAPGVTNPSSVVSLEFSPSVALLKKGDAKDLKVTATMADGTKKDVTDEVEWASENPNTATITPKGQLVGTGAGITTINANYKDAKGSIKVTVAP